MTEEKEFPNPSLISDFGQELLDQEAQAREMLETGEAPGAITGFETLDEELGGFLARGLHVVIAAPGAGKTALALQIAGACGCPALYVTSEMPRVELLRRVIAQTTNTYLGKLRGGRLSQDTLKTHIIQAALKCPMLAIYDATRDAASADDVIQKAEALRLRFDAKKVLVVVDSVTDWAAAAMTKDKDIKKVLTEYVVAEEALNGLKALTANIPGAVLAISHQNRASKNTEGTDKLFAAKGTGRYEYIAESLWYLDRDFGEPGAVITEATITILKNRHGAANIEIPLKFEGRIQRFAE